MEQLEGFIPWGETPLVHAMVDVGDSGFPANFDGFKTMVVVTDGEDNEFKDDKPLQRRLHSENLGECLINAFQKLDVLLNVIGYQVESKEEPGFIKQFKDVTVKDLKGKFYREKDKARLVQVMRKLMRQQLRFQIFHSDSGRLVDENMPEGGWEIRRLSANARWTTNLAPGRYLIRVQINKRVLEQEVDLAAGDYLLASLNADGDRLHFERVVYGEGYRKDRHADQGNWLMTVFQDQLGLPERSLDMMVTLENQSEKAPKAGSILQQIRPRVTWLELRAQQGDAEAAVRWGDLPDYPAPAWSLHVPRWPQRQGRAEAARPDVEAWWMWLENAPVAATLEWKKDFSLERAFLGPKELGNDATIKINIDSVGFETRRIQPDDNAPNRD
jgi:hypothetical protein